MLVIKLQKNGLIVKEWIISENEDLEKSIIEMLDIDFNFIKKIRGL